MDTTSIHEARLTVRELANQAFSRAAGAPLLGGNNVKLLTDARENYPAWLGAIKSAKHYINFENYIYCDDPVGRTFAEALTAQAKSGVVVRVVYDWLGCFGKASGGYWNSLREGGCEVRCFNPPSLESPFGWLARNHRKTVAVDGEVGFASGLCVGQMWEGYPDRKLDGWRDTGVEVRGPAVEEIDNAFAKVWATLGDSIPVEQLGKAINADAYREQGKTMVRVVATEPATAGLFRIDQLIASLAQERLWLADPYFAGTASYVQALCAAARDGIDVRMLVPNSTDVPLLKPLSRAGYPPLLEAGVRIFEWDGTMMHAKSAIADGKWARVGSTNLNISSWFGNCELDIVIEDEEFCNLMQRQYERDLESSTELVLNTLYTPHAPDHPRRARKIGLAGGSAGRAASGAARIGNIIGASITNRRVLEPVEARVALIGAGVLGAAAVVFAVFPVLLVYPAVVLFAWLAVSLAIRAIKLGSIRKHERASDQL